MNEDLKGLMGRQYKERQELLKSQEAERTALGKDILPHQEARLKQAKSDLNKKHIKEHQAYQEKLTGKLKSRARDLNKSKAKAKTQAKAKVRAKAKTKAPQKSKGRAKGKGMDMG